MSAIAIDLGPKPAKRAARRWHFWHRLAERLDALVAYPIKNTVSDQELRRVDEDIKRCRELMAKSMQRESRKTGWHAPGGAIRTVKIR
jgi:hypothetical protein